PRIGRRVRGSPRRRRLPPPLRGRSVLPAAGGVAAQPGGERGPSHQHRVVAGGAAVEAARDQALLHDPVRQPSGTDVLEDRPHIQLGPADHVLTRPDSRSRRYRSQSAHCAARARTSDRVPKKIVCIVRTSPDIAVPKQTVPTGLSGVPPAGPAMPVTATESPVPIRAQAPAAMAAATSSLTAPWRPIRAASTPSIPALASSA